MRKNLICLRRPIKFKMLLLLPNEEYHQVIILKRLLFNYCSNEYERVKEQGIKTWCFYRYSLTFEYKEKPPLAPPLIVINLLWRMVTSVCQRCYKKCKTCCRSQFLPIYTLILALIASMPLFLIRRKTHTFFVNDTLMYVYTVSPTNCHLFVFRVTVKREPISIICRKKSYTRRFKFVLI